MTRFSNPIPVMTELERLDMLARIDEKSVPEPMSGCFLWFGAHCKKGYGRIKFGRRLYLAHRIVYALTVGAIPYDREVCHRCDNPCCVNPAHLWLGTRRDNAADCVAKGRQNFGERHPLRRLSRVDVADIRHSHSSGERLAAIAARYQISARHAHKIVIGTRWRVA